jgi:hypothetical protein
MRRGGSQRSVPMLEPYLRELISTVKRLARELRLSINEQKQQSAAIAGYAKAHNDSRNPNPPIIRSEVQIPPEIIQRYEANQREQNRIQNRNFLIGVLTLAVLVIYTGFTGWTVHEIGKQNTSMRAQLGLMEKQYEAAARPWIKVSITASNAITYSNLGEAQFSLSIGMKNIGGSVAADCVVKFKFLVPKGNEVFTKPVEQQINLCGSPPNSIVRDDSPIKTTVFPDDERRLGIGGNIKISDIRSSSFPDSGPLKGRFFAPLVL